VGTVRLVGDFFPFLRVERGKVSVAFEVSRDFRDDELVGVAQPFGVKLGAADQEGFRRLVLSREPERLIEVGGGVAAAKRRAASRVTTILRRPGNGRPIDSWVLRPMMIGAPMVVRLKNARSSGRRHGSWLSRPITPLRARATIRVSVVIE
jgi:hypothetical protein